MASHAEDEREREPPRADYSGEPLERAPAARPLTDRTGSMTLPDDLLASVTSGTEAAASSPPAIRRRGAGVAPRAPRARSAAATNCRWRGDVPAGTVGAGVFGIGQEQSGWHS